MSVKMHIWGSSSLPAHRFLQVGTPQGNSHVDVQAKLSLQIRMHVRRYHKYRRGMFRYVSMVLRRVLGNSSPVARLENWGKTLPKNMMTQLLTRFIH